MKASSFILLYPILSDYRLFYSVLYYCSVTLDQNIIDGIEALAEEDSRSFSQYVNIVLPFVLPVFADDPQQRVYVSSALTVSTLVTIAGFAVLAAVGI